MTKQHQPLYLSPKAADTLKALAATLDCSNQRNQHSIGSLCEWLARTADGSFGETVAALNIAAGCAAGEDWYELIEVIEPKLPAE